MAGTAVPGFRDLQEVPLNPIRNGENERFVYQT